MYVYVWVGVRACVYERVWACSRKPVNMCVCVSGYTSILIYTHTVYVCVCVYAYRLLYECEDVCVSVCQFHFALYEKVCVVRYYYAIE